MIAIKNTHTIGKRDNSIMSFTQTELCAVRPQWRRIVICKSLILVVKRVVKGTNSRVGVRG